MPDPAIEIENLTKEYPFGFLHLKKRTSLEGLSMQVEMGDVFGFIGPNGAGKSTTIKLLMGLIFPTAGSARILGKPIRDVEMHRDIGYLPEQPYFYDYLTAAEVLDYFARFHDLTAAGRKDGDVFHAHSLGRGDVMRPHGRDCRGETSRGRRTGHTRRHEDAGNGNSLRVDEAEQRATALQGHAHGRMLPAAGA